MMISYPEAYQCTLENIQALDAQTVPLLEAAGRTLAQDLLARVDSPSVDVSLKDGYALRGEEVRHTTPDSPVRLKLVGSAAAGQGWEGVLQPGEAIRILSGAPLPQGANAVLAEEFARESQPGTVDCLRDADQGRNILPQGSDVYTGQILTTAGERLPPTTVGLLAAAGFSHAPVVRRPRVAILATGDEVLAPGQPLLEGKLYASNLFTLASWCRQFGYPVETRVLPDEAAAIRRAMVDSLAQNDAVLTSGGAWKGRRDLVVQILDELGWHKFYHHVRMGPGKAVGFGVFEGKPVFCLPGGPPSNHMAFLQLALPGLGVLSGASHPGLPTLPATLGADLRGQIDWTQFVHGRLERQKERLVFIPLRYPSRLQEMAHTQAVAALPEGQDHLPAGSAIWVQVLTM
jgi:molybdopterin molybdotransferase